MAVMELITVSLEIGMAICKFISERKRKSSNLGSTLETVESILREMEPRITHIQRLNEEMGRPKEGKEFIRKLEEGYELVRKCSEIHGYSQKKKWQKKLEEWEHSFRGLLSLVMQLDMVRDVKEIAFNMKEIKQLLHPHQLEYSEEEYDNKVVWKYNNCIEKLKSLSIEDSKDEKEVKQNAKVFSFPPSVGLSGSESRIMHSKEKMSMVVQRKVVLEVLVHCCKACPRKAKKAEREVVGVKSVIVDETQDLIAVMGTMDLEELIKYLKKKLDRKTVHVVSDTLEEQE